jgi:hypothetical protein
LAVSYARRDNAGTHANRLRRDALTIDDTFDADVQVTAAIDRNCSFQ